MGVLPIWQKKRPLQECEADDEIRRARTTNPESLRGSAF